MKKQLVESHKQQLLYLNIKSSLFSCELIFTNQTRQPIAHILTKFLILLLLSLWQPNFEIPLTKEVEEISYCHLLDTDKYNEKQIK